METKSRGQQMLMHNASLSACQVIYCRVAYEGSSLNRFPGKDCLVEPTAISYEKLWRR